MTVGLWSRSWRKLHDRSMDLYRKSRGHPRARRGQRGQRQDLHRERCGARQVDRRRPPNAWTCASASSPASGWTRRRRGPRPRREGAHVHGAAQAPTSSSTVSRTARNLERARRRGRSCSGSRTPTSASTPTTTSATTQRSSVAWFDARMQ
ncbi:hypothetical protein QJS66_12920 [Kocuria rhizophila]|nr:hypothetical protein QJS66_12920 [Kocuria rhizophila]